ncbi:hypothetical protein [Azospirillum sp. A39]|uniref:hypothetical protein n=1 Tax=Azospirillum sp. A39 TaxID=3462279 RepID=UPI0040453A55
MTGAGRDVALALGVAAMGLRRGTALDRRSREALADLLLRAAMALAGKPPPARIEADPLALIAVSIETARAAGVPAADVVTTVNDVLERSVRPL